MEEVQHRTLTAGQCRQFHEEGFVMCRAVFDPQEIASLRSAFDCLLELLTGGGLPEVYLTAHPDAEAGPTGRVPRIHFHVGDEGLAEGGDRAKHLRKINWPSYAHPAFDAVRRSPKFPALLAPLLGSDGIKQFINQVNFKNPGGGMTFPMHQDIRDPHVAEPLANYVQTYLLVDRATEENGCLSVIPRSQLDGPLAKPLPPEAREKLVNEQGLVMVTGEPGDLLLFSTYTVHGSGANCSSSPRRSYINGFLRGAAAKTGYCVPAFAPCCGGEPAEAMALDSFGYDYSDLGGGDTTQRHCRL
jgi:hypothetical protein